MKIPDGILGALPPFVNSEGDDEREKGRHGKERTIDCKTGDVTDDGASGVRNDNS